MRNKSKVSPAQIKSAKGNRIHSPELVFWLGCSTVEIFCENTIGNVHVFRATLAWQSLGICMPGFTGERNPAQIRLNAPRTVSQ